MSDLIQVFHADLAKFADKLKVAKKTVMQKVSQDLYTKITERTTVLTGRARANWMLSIGAPSQEVKEYKDAKAGEISPPPTPDVSNVDGTQPVFIVNNLNYIRFLEDGSSKQSPAGMLKVSMVEEAATIEAAIRSAD